jgi:NitT/TauT family transport system ATP-binding protein
MLISLTGISFNFETQKILNNFNLEFGNESPTVILGPSGCGKTTLLKIIAGLIKPVSGQISFSEDGAPALQVKRSYMFQEPRLLPWMTVLENVMLPLKKVVTPAAAKRRAMHFLELVSLQTKAHILPANLSGGENQRASMARAFTFNTPILLLDEPFQSLDIPLRISLMDTLLTLLQEGKRTCLLVTHDPREAIYLGERILVINKAESNEGVKIVLDEKCTSVCKTAHSFVNKDNVGQEERLIAALSA